ncbi:beta-hexosaminidase [Xylaria bambusicola]|uniref:beta-hexosaminidase n=1 Tax=Xylaria bambusicola TaxID=326684 RepID=UPI0020084100|nr:beta-hexosaminidase [Xylaria bambusicola]KAI0527732.1 beta-hexosaminidase [Xylaria bambusicola]
MACLRLNYLFAVAILGSVVSSARLIGIPTLPFNASAVGQYPVSAIKSILVDRAFANHVDQSGETLIPPTLRDFAGTFASDLHDIWRLDVSVSVASEPEPHAIYLSIAKTPFSRYANGVASPEGYAFEVTTSGIIVHGASPLGVWWGTRSLIQQAILSNGSLPLGKSVDSPGWKTRGMMLDAARHYYPPEFVIELCSYMSFFKQNTLQLHLSDNLYNSPRYTREQSLSLYARFRLWSDAPGVEGLARYKNESYTKNQFKSIQSECVARGVTIIPELEAPGHALPIVQWKPELGLADDLSLLNISHPDTIPTMKTIWSTFLSWFDSKTVHIGADEYTAGVTEYNRFVNEMAEFIRINGSKSIRIWGTFPPKPEYDNITTDVSIQHWEFFEDNPLFDYIKNNYSVVNSDDIYYVVNKYSQSYPPAVNIAKTFHGNPGGGPWQPYIFDTNNATNNPDRANKHVLGAITPLWNDFGPNATVYSETYYAWREGIPALADKQWGGDLREDEFEGVLEALQDYIPGQNLARSIPSKSSEIVHYGETSFTDVDVISENIAKDKNMMIRDLSGNKYHATTDCPRTPRNTLLVNTSCAFKTPLQSKGREYTLSMIVYVDAVAAGRDATLISGADSALMLTPTVSLFASGNYYRLVNVTLPVKTWVELSIIAKGNQTFARVVEMGGKDVIEEEFRAVVGVNGMFLVDAEIAVEAPLAEIRGEGWEGEIGGLMLRSVAE